MGVTAADPAGSALPEPGGREHVSNLYSLFVLSTMMSHGRSDDEILELATTSVPSLGPCRVEASYLAHEEEPGWSCVGRQRPDPKLEAQLAALAGADGPVAFPHRPWAYALTLQSLAGHRGYLVVGAETEPSNDELFLVKMLVQQTAAALANASLHRQVRQNALQVRLLNEQRAAVNARLTATVSDLERQTKIHEAFVGISASGEGEEGISRVLHELTGLPVAVEDRFGNLRCWIGPGRPEPYPKLDARSREDVLRAAASHGRPMRDRERLVALAQPRNETLGVIALLDPARTAGPYEVSALEHAATMLAMELAHLRSLAEVELRLRRDLVDDLVTGTDDGSAYARAEVLGHDLYGAHYLVLVKWRGGTSEDAVARAVEHAAAALGMHALLARRPGVVVMLTRGRPKDAALHAAVARELGTVTGAIGVGGRCDSPADFPRSFQEAVRALEIREKSHAPHGVTAFDELGVYRILGTRDGDQEVELFVREWLGPLLDYDRKRHSELVKTLSRYLECGGNYDSTAASLVIHRSTLRYRLQRIREITGHDLGDVDDRLNLHVATRAWKVLEGST